MRGRRREGASPYSLAVEGLVLAGLSARDARRFVDATIALYARERRPTASHVGEVLGMSRQRIQQIQKRALEKLRGKAER